jgi:hypothetical protein
LRKLKSRNFKLRVSDDMTERQPFPVKKTFLYALIGSIILGALLGITAILSGRFGWLEVRVLLTTATIAVASICGLACGAHLSTGRGRALPLAGIALTLVAAGMLIGGIWHETFSDSYWQTTASASVFAVACAHLSLLSMARLADWFRWSLTVAYVVILGVAGLIVLMILREQHGAGMMQLLGVATIVDAAITIVIPILHRLSRDEISRQAGTGTAGMANLQVAEIDAEIARLRDRIAVLEQMKLQLRINSDA